MLGRIKLLCAVLVSAVHMVFITQLPLAAGAAQWATQPPPPPARCPLERAVHNLLPGGGVLAYTERSLWLACEQVSTW